ncbi:hypothetical protein ES703_58661 [subsurface metagenome]
MRHNLKVNQVGQLVMPRHIRQAWGTEYVILPNEEAGAIYPKGADPKKVVKSLRLVIQDIENQIEGKEDE